MLNPVPLTVPLDDRLVKAPVDAAVPPIAGGEAKSEVKPAPFTVEVAESVVKAPVEAAVEPIAGGEANKDVNPAPFTVEVAESVVNAPVEAVVLPTAVLFKPLEADKVVKAPVDGVPEPIAVGEANVAPPSCAALTAVLHVNPVLVMYARALALVEHEGIAKAVGVALDAVTFASTVFAACVASAVKEIGGKLAVPVTVRAPVTSGPLKVAPASGAYKANCEFNSAAVRTCPGANCAFAIKGKHETKPARSFFMRVSRSRG